MVRVAASERQSAAGEDQSRLLEARGVSLKDSRGALRRRGGRAFARYPIRPDGRTVGRGWGTQNKQGPS